ACHADGEENSCGLDGCRPTINAIMYGEASALASMARLLANETQALRFDEEAAKWQQVILQQLWSDELQFFVTKTVNPPRSLHEELVAGRLVTYFGCLACDPKRTCPPPRGWPHNKQVTVRELMGLSSPWYFNAVPATPEAAQKYAAGFAQLRDAEGFGAEWGPRTCERRHACYNFSNNAQCNWNGGSWPFETSKVGTALINLLNNYPPQPHADAADFVRLLAGYARAHTRSNAVESAPPHIDEDIHPDDGYWITRRKLFANAGDPLKNRGEHYFHSSYCDLVLAGLVGMQAPTDGERAKGALFVVNPLVGDLQAAAVEWFAATDIMFHGHQVSVVYDRDGEHYQEGRGLHVWVNNRKVVTVSPLKRFVYIPS
ncbi:hypothetical protein CYMTET_29437, partial [Cymbomonas tetramitiformis]